MSSVHENSALTEEWLSSFKNCGITIARVIAQEYCPDKFGNGEAVFQSGELQLKIERDRGEDQVCVSFEPQLDRYYSIDDVRVAFGWEKASQVAARTEIPSLMNQLQEVGDSHSTFFDRLTGSEAPFWRARIEDIETKRYKATLERFR